MKEKFCLLFSLFILTTQFFYGQTSSYLSKPKIYAVIVGVSTYKDSNIPNLKYPEKDAAAFYEFLRSAKAGAVAEENIALLTGSKATRSSIFKELEDKFTRSNKDDLVLFYFSGHGKAGVFENTGFLLNYDAENGNDIGSALSMSEIKNTIDKCQAKMKISYIDACHAGLFKTNTKGTLEEDNSIIVSAYLEGLSRAGDGNLSFLASSARQQSLEDDRLGHGVFTYYLLEGLKGEADKEQEGAEGYNNGIVTAGELATYLTNKIQSTTKYKQKPTIDGNYDEFFPLSILRSGISISGEMAKRPVKKNTISDKKKDDAAPNEKPCNKQVGDYCFYNSTNFSAQLYLDITGDTFSQEKLALTLSPSQSDCLLDIPEGVHKIGISFIGNTGVQGTKILQIRVEKCNKTPKPVTLVK